MRLTDWHQVEQAEGEFHLYRASTVGLLRKYLRMAAEAGRLPSLIGREYFRSVQTLYSEQNFEEVVNFVIDVERCLEALDPQAQAVIACVFFQEYSYEEAASRFGITVRSLYRRVAGSIDHLSRIFLQRAMLKRLDEAVSAFAVARELEHRKALRNAPIAGVPFRLLRPSGFLKKPCQAKKVAETA